jgi:hypothetical protein
VRLGFFELVQAARDAAKLPSRKSSKCEEAPVVVEESAAEKKKRLRAESSLQTHGSHSDPSYMMRFMVLGNAGRPRGASKSPRNSKAPAADTATGVLLTYESPQGTPEEIWAAWRAWESMDQVCDGYVDTYDFFRWVSDMDKSKHSAFLWKAVAGQEERIRMKHLLRILWPRAERANLDDMVDYIEQRNTQNLLRVPEPDVMLPEMRNDLAKVFEALDADGDGDITVQELVGAGFMHREEAVEKVDRFSRGAGSLTVEQFVEMMCPDGIRYSADTTVALCGQGDGAIIRLNPNDGKWYRSTLPCNRFLRSLYPERYSGQGLSAAAL